jgi:integrase
MSFKPIKKGQYAYKRIGKRTTDYRVIFRQGGLYLNEKLIDVTDDKDALIKARKRISEAERDHREKDRVEQEIKENSPLVRFETIIDQVIESKQTASTRRQVRHFLKSVVLPILEKHCPFVQEFGPTGPEDFITWFQTERPGQKAFNPRKYFFQVLRRAKKLGLLRPDVIIEAKNPDPKRAKGKVYHDDELRSLLEHAEGDLELQLLMAISMGMRKSEILKLRWDRLNPFFQTIALRAEDTKIREGREFKVPSLIWDALMARKEASTSEWVFPSRSNPNAPIIDNKTAWAACKERARVRGRFHDLRHTFLTNEIMVKKKNPNDVCAYAGLSLEELKTYLHPTHQQTAYIAQEQNQKLLSIVSVKKNCNNFCNNSLERARNDSRFSILVSAPEADALSN